MKRKMFFRLAVVCLIAASALIACTKDYGSDIKALQDDVNGLKNDVESIQKMITEDGCVITAVTPVEGGTEVTLSNGKKFTVLNGAKGDPGKDGTVWKIGDNGNWWSSTEGNPFVDSGMKAQGPKGDTGKSAYEASGFTGTEAEWIASLQGKDGKSAYEIAAAENPEVAAMTPKQWAEEYLKGPQGDPGKNGDYYYPCVDKNDPRGAYKHWVKVDGTTGDETVLDALWLSDDVVTAVWDPDTQTLTLHNVEGADDGIVTINLSTVLKSIAIIPEMWDADLGMPTAQVYAIMPQAYETIRALSGKQEGVRFRDILWPGNTYADPVNNNMYIWLVLYNSYLGKNGLTYYSDYDARYDCSSSQFTYWDRDKNANSGASYETTYQTYVEAVETVLQKMSAGLAAAGVQPWQTSRIPPVSALKLKYRVNPKGADLGGYQFKMIDRSLKVVNENKYYIGRLIDDDYNGQNGYPIYSKATGDNRANAVPVLEAKYDGRDQIDVTGYISYFKYWADMPTEWFLRMLTTREMATWSYWQMFNQRGDIPNRYDVAYAADILGKYIADPSSNDLVSHKDIMGDFSALAGNVKSMNYWLAANGISFETIFALEAAKSNNGAEAVVSDYNNVKLEFVTPIWTAYQHRYREAPYDDYCCTTELWPMACNWASMNASNTQEYENDYLVVGKTYDVASHMRFADPYYGKLENLGFEVDYKYYVFCEANGSQNPTNNYFTPGHWYQESWDPGEETESNYGAWDKVECTTDGKVKVKDGATNAIGKYVIITASATIKNKATGVDYTSNVIAGQSGYDSYAPQRNLVGEDLWDIILDEFTGHYVFLIVPDTTTTVNVEKFIGTYNYLELPGTGFAPQSVAEQAVEMDADGFNRIYGEPVATTSAPQGYSLSSYSNGFNVALSAETLIGENQSITYTFEPKEEFAGKYPTICYTIKWTVTMNWTAVEPVLNPDYILYDKDEDGNKTGLAKTDIDPDPVTKYPTARPEGNFPYVDTVIRVKGKRVVEDGVAQWAPQASIRENLYKYGTPLYDIDNVDDVSMSINFANSLKDASSAKLWTKDGSDDLWSFDKQEIRQMTPFAAGELSRDYVIEITVKLANGQSQMVKAYILRFVCPMYIRIVDTDPDSAAGDVDLYTHRNDWCSDRSVVQIVDVGNGTGNDEQVLVWFELWYDRFGNPHFTKHISPFARQTYGENMTSSNIKNPKWHAEGDGTFGSNLQYEEYTGWFYWYNNGDDLQENKFTPYTVEVEVTGLATLQSEGLVYVHRTEESQVAHNMEPGNPAERKPNEDNVIVLPTYETVFDE